MAAAAAHATAAPEPELMPIEPAEDGGGTRLLAAAVDVEPVVEMEVVFGATLTEEVTPDVPEVEPNAPVAGGLVVTELSGAGAAFAAKFDVEGSELGTAELLTAAALVVVPPVVGGTAGVLLVLVLELPWVKLLIFLGNLRPESSETTRASTAGSDRWTAICSSRLTLMGMAAALTMAMARRTKEGA